MFEYLLQSVIMYLENSLRLIVPPDDEAMPNISALADGSEEELVKFIQLILTCFALSPENKEYIQRIQSLAQADQRVIMNIISKIHSLRGSDDSESVSSTASKSTLLAPQDLAQDESTRIELEMLRIIKESELIATRNDDLDNQFKSLADSNDEKSRKILDLEGALERAEFEISKLKNHADVYLTNQIDALQEDLMQSNKKLSETSEELRRFKSSALSSTQVQQSNRRLEKECDELRSRLEKLQSEQSKYLKAESLLEKYKSKLRSLQYKESIHEGDNAEIERLRRECEHTQSQLEDLQKELKLINEMHKKQQIDIEKTAQSEIEYKLAEYKRSMDEMVSRKNEQMNSALDEKRSEIQSIKMKLAAENYILRKDLNLLSLAWSNVGSFKVSSLSLLSRCN